jgi:uncharacterized protein (TIGR00661 family)
MNGQNINIASRPLRVLISPLDWGLGHATRIITIVKTLQKYDVQVLIAAEGPVAALLQKEFSDLKILPLPGYNIRYSKKKQSFFWKLLLQIPKILGSIRAENRILKQWIQQYELDGIISDNRFGFYHRSVPSVYITHQLYIETGKKWLSNRAQKIHYQYIHRFSECWVPDFEKGISLAGKLSHPAKMPLVPTHYIGPLSRFKKNITHPSGHLLILLSGPEPQRSIWENLLLKDLKNYPEPCTLVRGLPSANTETETYPFLKIYNHLPAAELNHLIESSGMVISRSGYSTVMDLFALGKKAILVPTPGQAEQEYLASYLKEKKLFYSCDQEHIDLPKTLAAAEIFEDIKTGFDYETFNEPVIKRWVDQLRTAMA